jgi:hypothetical protein
MSSSGEELPDAGTAGASARREHARRASRREAAVRKKHPMVGGALLALSDEPAHQSSWERGAAGEERVAGALSRYAAEHVVLLHDRQIPRSKTNIDQIAITCSGIWVIDAKRYHGKVEIRRPLLGQPKLLINGRDRTKLVDGLTRQIQIVNATIAETAPDVPVHGAMAFVDADLPLLRRLEPPQAFCRILLESVLLTV